MEWMGDEILTLLFICILGCTVLLLPLLLLRTKLLLHYILKRQQKHNLCLYYFCTFNDSTYFILYRDTLPTLHIITLAWHFWHCGCVHSAHSRKAHHPAIHHDEGEEGPRISLNALTPALLPLAPKVLHTNFLHISVHFRRNSTLRNSSLFLCERFSAHVD
jgi:hypothetical protein